MKNILLKQVQNDTDFEHFIGEFTSYESMKTFHYNDKTLKLERMAAFLKDIGNPQLSYPTIHIAGTKGKGTTCLILENLLSQNGKKVGSYLSPHIEHIRERIRFSNRSINETELCNTLNAMLDVLNRRRNLGEDHFPTFFELMTSLAMAFFHDREVHHGIFEVGLGGRLDATNVLSPSWTAITSISLEHTQKLGNTLASIAREKAGILKAGIPVIVGPGLPGAEKKSFD